MSKMDRTSDIAEGTKVVQVTPDGRAIVDGPSPSGISRRHLLMGGAMLAVSGLAYARTPKRRYPAYSKEAYEALFPSRFGEWQALPTSELILPPDSELANKLYEHILTRSYANAQGQVVMFLAAYSSLQIDDVQVHRPEVCYTVAGFNIKSNATHSLPITDEVKIPTRVVVAERPMREETILYWTRVGANFPTGWAGQRFAMMTANLEGFYPDGILVRASVIDEGSDDLAILTRFYRDLASHSSAQTHRLLYNA